jgi:hypothetical protein
MSEPRIVFFDIETLPDLRQALLAWPGLSNYPGTTFKASLNSVCCFGYKVRGEEKARVICAWDFPEWQENVNDDGPLLRAVYEVLKDVDGVITQNGKSFDEKFLRTRMLLKGVPGLPPMKHTDTKLLARKFSFFSNSLRYLAEQLTEERKIENEGWPLWVKVHDRVSEAQETMRTYCAGDVEALEAIYRVLRTAAGGANAAPNHNLYQIAQGGLRICPECGSSRLQARGVQVTKTKSYRRYHCQDCSSWSRTDATDKLPRSL